MSLPSNPFDGQTTIFMGKEYIFDSDSRRWIIYKSKDLILHEVDVDSDFRNLKFNDLHDVNVIYPPEDETILSWDSDSQNWVSRQFTHDPLGAVALYLQSNVSTAGQTVFRLDFFPIGNVDLNRNGVDLSSDCYEVVGRFLTYDPLANGNAAFEEGDKLTFTYNRGTSIAITAELADLTDVDVLSVLPKNGDLLVWDSDYGVFAPSNSIQENLDQAISDRVYTDNLLSGRIDDLDSDLNARGSFYVQSTQPVGSPNSGWVNTNNMRLHIWDVNSENWIEVITR